MKLAEYSSLLKYIFISIVIIIAVGSLIVSNSLVKDLSREERQKIELWSEATQQVANEEDESNMELILQILSSNSTIPVILCDSSENIISHANLNLTTEQESDSIYMRSLVKQFEKKHTPIIIDNVSFKQFVYYDDSYTLKRLQTYPYIQIVVFTIFVLISILALSSTKKAEQNKVWVGLSKETAHQLGTPISSLIAWTEYMKLKDPNGNIAKEMEKDVNRLQIVADRFSKIGSTPSNEILEMQSTVMNSVNYLENRISKKVTFTFSFPETPIYAELSTALFSWVIENITKNAVDAMEGIGSIDFSLTENSSKIFLDIKDSGKGIPKSKFKTIFTPGYTTKKRGWGLGLSLTKRIIESYHNGRIYVKSSEIGLGTTFRIELKKASR